MNSSVCLAIGMKLRPLLRTDFSASESDRFSGIVTTVFSFWFSRGAVLFFLCDFSKHCDAFKAFDSFNVC